MKQLFILKESQTSIKSASDLFDNIKEINIDYSQENFILIGLSTNNEVIFKKVLFKGGLNSCIIDIRTIFKHLFVNDCNAFIVAHNHPSNNLIPSNEDRQVYKALIKSGNVLQTTCLDSIIFNKDNYFSLKNN